jgi:glutathione S-transferase
MMETQKLKLVYFKMRALAEAPQILMSVAGIDYEYLMAWEYFEKPWSDVKSSVVFKQLPILVVNEKEVITHSGSILRYLAGLAGMVPTDLLSACKADAILEAAQEMFAPLNPTMNFAVGADYEAKSITMLPSLASKVDDFERLLENAPETPFFMGDLPCHCDFSVYHHISMAQRMHPHILDNSPNLKYFLSAVEALPGAQSYLAQRPDLIDVGHEPKLVIDGRPVPTGLMRTD